MLTPARKSPDERGKHWLHAKVQQILAESGGARATPCPEDTPACYWGTGPDTETTLYVLFTGDPEPKMLRFNPALLHDGGAGRFTRQQQATAFIRRTLKKMGLLSA